MRIISIRSALNASSPGCQNLECRSCGVRVGVAGLRGELRRAKDMASTYRLCPHLRIWFVSGVRGQEHRET